MRSPAEVAGAFRHQRPPADGVAPVVAPLRIPTLPASDWLVGGAVAQRANLIVRLLHQRELLLNNGLQVWGKILPEGVAIGAHGIVLSALRFGEDLVLAVPGQGALQLDPCAVHFPAHTGRIVCFPAGSLQRLLQLCREGCALLRVFLEYALQTSVFDGLGRAAKTFLGVPAHRNHIVYSGNVIFSHWSHSSPRGLSPSALCFTVNACSSSAPPGRFARKTGRDLTLPARSRSGCYMDLTPDQPAEPREDTEAATRLTNIHLSFPEEKTRSILRHAPGRDPDPRSHRVHLRCRRGRATLAGVPRILRPCGRGRPRITCAARSGNACSRYRVLVRLAGK